MTEKELLDFKKEIDQAKEEILQLKGQKKALLTQLKDDWDCKTLEQAEKKLKDLQSQVNKIQEDIDSGIQTLEEKYF